MTTTTQGQGAAGGAALERERRRMTQARVSLLLGQPFFGTLALRLRVVADPSAPTCYRDGIVLGLNPAFTATLTDLELAGVVAHEVLHCAMGHAWRGQGREHERWNAAADYAVNPIVARAGLELPKSALANPAWAGMAAEEIYPLLPEGQGKAQGGAGYGGDFGEVRAPQDGDGHGGAGEVDPKALAVDWGIAVRQAAAVAKGRGALPAGLEELVQTLTRPVVDWRALLRRFVQRCAAADFSWQAPSRRFMAQGLYMPCVRSEKVPAMVVAVDTSGSVSTQELEQFAGEVAGIVEEVRPEAVHVVYCDAAVQAVETFEEGARFQARPAGRGGTDFRPPFAWVEEHMGGQAPACLVYLTDMEGPFPEQAPGYPVLWVSTSREYVGPFGETVYLDPKG